MDQDVKPSLVTQSQVVKLKTNTTVSRDPKINLLLKQVNSYVTSNCNCPKNP